MNSLELLQEVRRLKGLKEKNEAAISVDDLCGKYAKSYGKLRGELKERQCELRSLYLHYIWEIGGILDRSIYVSTKEETEWLHKECHRVAVESKNDPLIEELLKVLWKFGEE